MELPKFSYSMRSMFRSCPRKVFYKYVAGIEPIGEDNSARAIGRAFHKALELWRTGDDIDSAFMKTVSMFEDDLKVQNFTQEEIMDEMAKLSAYLRGYALRFADDSKIPEWGVEVELSNSNEVGYLDGLFVKGEEVWGLEDKTRSVFSEHRQAALKIDEQLLTYAILLKEQGYSFGGMIYRETLKTRCKRKKGETAEEFRGRVLEDYTLKSDDKYREMVVEFSKADIEEYRTEKFLTDVIIRNTFKLPPERKFWPRNTDSCIGVYGACDYYKLCVDTQKEEIVRCFKRGDKPPRDGGQFLYSSIGDEG